MSTIYGGEAVMKRLRVFHERGIRWKVGLYWDIRGYRVVIVSLEKRRAGAFARLQAKRLRIGLTTFTIETRIYHG
jgi:hypothetical protein